MQNCEAYIFCARRGAEIAVGFRAELLSQLGKALSNFKRTEGIVPYSTPYSLLVSFGDGGTPLEMKPGVCPSDIGVPKKLILRNFWGKGSGSP